MKKKIFIICLVFILVGCSSKSIEKKDVNKKEETKIPILKDSEISNDNDIKEIKDNVFVQFTEDMYYNPEDYENKKFLIEGFIYINTFESSDELHNFIVRKTPGCCGSDGLAGLEFYYDGKIPKNDTWVTGKGIWKKTNITDVGYILVLYSLEETKKGNEFLDHNY